MSVLRRNLLRWSGAAGLAAALPIATGTAHAETDQPTASTDINTVSAGN
jgi:hypothetical protein